MVYPIQKWQSGACKLSSDCRKSWDLNKVVSCHDILTEKLSMHQVAANIVPQLMTKQQMETRLNVCLQLLE